MQRTKWFERKFPVIQDNGILPSIIERLDGTPAHIAEIISNTNAELLVAKPNDKWTIQEQVGHLADLEPLWLGRVDDLTNDLQELRVADLTNQKTHNANHNATDIKILMQQFREQRKVFVSRLRNLTDEQLLKSALHPRLKTPMRIIDLAFFVAEHDDHHLADIHEIIHRNIL